MTDIPKRREQIYITKSHLFALSITTLGISILTFSLGYKVGLTQAAPVPEVSTPPLLPAADQQDTLEELLRQIEKAQEKAEATDYLFPDENKEAVLPIPQLPEEQGGPASKIRKGKEEPEAPEFTEQKLPGSGWAVQVGSYPNLDEAQERISSLQEAGKEAYYIVAAVNDQNWYRVRVGGFRTKEAADKGRQALGKQLDEADFLIYKAP
jgi:cell division protein FtsN